MSHNQTTTQWPALPVGPKLLPQLDEWSGAIKAELELADSIVRKKDFSGVARLDMEGCQLIGVQLTGVSLRRLQLSDVLLDHVEAAGMHALRGGCIRVVVSDSRLTGSNMGEVALEDCLFKNVKLDEAGLRFATLKRVRFENCILQNTDLSGAQLSHVYFSGCNLTGTNFDKAACHDVDLRGEALGSIKGILGLKGATISSEQLVQLAPLFGAELGLDVDYET